MMIAAAVRAAVIVIARATALVVLLSSPALEAAGAGPGAGRAARHPWLHLAASSTGASHLELEGLWPGEDELAALRARRFGSLELLARFELHVSSDGTLTERAVVARYYLTEEGVRELGTFGTSVRSDVEDLYLDRAYVHQSRDIYRELDLSRAQITTGGAADIFSDVFRVMVPFEGLTVGSTAVLEYRVVKRVNEWPLPWSEIYPVRAFFPIRRFDVRITWDPDIEAPVWKTDADHLACLAAGERSVRCEARDIEPLEADEEVQFPIETVPLLVVTQRHTWDDLVRAESRLVAASMRSMDRIAVLTDQVLGDAQSSWDRLTRIHRFTSDKIRYVALEHGPSAVAPADVAHTADRRYGDCKDKVALFLAMARHAGLDAYPVLVATDRVDPEKLIIPSWQFFDHMIACVNVPELDDPVCVDQTVPSAGTGVLPPALYGAVILRLQKGSAALATLPVPMYVWDIDIDAENMVQCDGAIRETLSRRFRGPGEVMLRSMVRRLNSKDRRRWLIDDYKATVATDFDPEPSLGGVDEVDVPLTLMTTTLFETGFTPDQASEYVELDQWFTNYARWFATKNARLPVRLKGGRVSSRLSLQVCPDWDIGFLGPELNFKSEFGTLMRRYVRKPATVIVHTTLDLPSQVIGASELEKYRRFLDRALEQTRIWFGISNKPARPGRRTR